MPQADSVTVTIPTDTAWHNVWDLCAAQRITDVLPPIEKFARTLNLESDVANTDTIQWSRTGIGNNYSGQLLPRESLSRQSGDLLVNENLYTLYVRLVAGIAGQKLLVERTQ